MNEKIKKLFALPLDNSATSLKSIDYLNLIFESQQNIDVALLHTIPAPLFPCANLHV